MRSILHLGEDALQRTLWQVDRGMLGHEGLDADSVHRASRTLRLRHCFSVGGDYMHQLESQYMREVSPRLSPGTKCKSILEFYSHEADGVSDGNNMEQLARAAGVDNITKLCNNNGHYAAMG